MFEERDPPRYLITWGECLQRAPVRLETSLSVKSSIVTKEEVTVARGGKVVDERSRETKENNYYASSTSEIWEPVGIVHRPRNIKPFDSSDDSRPNSNASSDQGYTTNTSSNHVLREASGSSTVGCPICEDNDPDCALLPYKRYKFYQSDFSGGNPENRASSGATLMQRKLAIVVMIIEQITTQQYENVVLMIKIRYQRRLASHNFGMNFVIARHNPEYEVIWLSQENFITTLLSIGNTGTTDN
ncbi:hypothetical protein WN51_00326 [Melipona quadrifasciata]|uniref:Uncharacterized protein n=1 Tax=Melipona quadrifasciata TaxID=166423 RepID=A0A0M8ZXN6_9HYME|nr:hypothetical protein WN51_00326 [Melipona quadrifasciata]